MEPTVGAGGRYVAFTSAASNLVPDDTNDVSDVFVRDRQEGTTELVSVSVGGLPASGFNPSTSGEGRYIAYASYAADLVAGDNNGTADVFVRDRLTGTTERVSVGSTRTGEAEANAWSGGPTALSADGRFVAFRSNASNLVTGDTNGVQDVFVRDRLYGITRRASVASDGTQGYGPSSAPAISGDGRVIAFESGATSLVGNDNNGVVDVFVHDRTSGATQRVSVDRQGDEGNDISSAPALSFDGRYVAFRSRAANLILGDTNNCTDVFVHDQTTGVTERVSVGTDGAQTDNHSHGPSLSAFGRYVTFFSYATNLAPGDTNYRDDVFVRDRQAGTTELVSVSTSGIPATGTDPAISGDGRYIAFTSSAAELVPEDTNAVPDVFGYARTLPSVVSAGPDPTVRENAGTLDVRVRRTGNIEATARVDYAATGGTAISGADFGLAPARLTFQPGDSWATIPLVLINDGAVERAETIVLTLSGPGAETVLGTRTTTTVTIQPSDQRPDAMISTRATDGYVGNDIYNETASQQTKQVNASRGQQRTFYARIQNDGNTTNAFSLKASTAPAAATMRYRLGGRDVTAALLSRTGLSVTLGPTANVRLQTSIDLRRSAKLGSTPSTILTCTWRGDGERTDTVRAVVRVVT